MTSLEVTHRCPPSGSGLTPCCNRTPFELPRSHRITLDPQLVTCGKSATPCCDQHGVGNHDSSEHDRADPDMIRTQSWDASERAADLEVGRD